MLNISVQVQINADLEIQHDASPSLTILSFIILSLQNDMRGFDLRELSQKHCAHWRDNAEQCAAQRVKEVVVQRLKSLRESGEV